MPSCCVPNCTTRRGIRMHQFPQEYERRIKWMKAVGREDLHRLDWQKFGQSFRVCTLHFSDDHKFPDNSNSTNLKKTAYPTLNLPSENQKGVPVLPGPGLPGGRRRMKANSVSKSACKVDISNSLERLLLTKEENEYVNFADVCRACLSTKHELTNIRKVCFGGLTVQELFEQYFAIKMDAQDDLPQHLCSMCLYELCRVYLFINNCRDADTKLKELISEEDKKQAEEPVMIPEKETELESDETEAEWNLPDGDKLIPLKVTEPGPPFICNNCSASFDTLVDIKTHRTLFKHYVVQQYLCRFCNPSKVYTYRRWKNHVRVHTGEKPYACHVCGRRFSGRSNLKRHVLTHTGVKRFACDQCDKAFTQSTNLKHHKLRSHLGKDGKRIKCRFQCEHCPKAFTTRAALSHHTVIHSEKTFLCNECGQSFHYKIQFNLHMESHQGIYRHQCNVCHKAFATSASLNLHQRAHSGYKPFECRYCEKRFALKTRLTIHMRIHTGEKPYACPYCDKAFSLNGNLTVHMRKHTGENPHVCDVCCKGFRDSKSLKKHRVRHFVDLCDILTVN